MARNDAAALIRPVRGSGVVAIAFIREQPIGGRNLWLPLCGELPAGPLAVAECRGADDLDKSGARSQLKGQFRIFAIPQTMSCADQRLASRRQGAMTSASVFTTQREKIRKLIIQIPSPF